MEINLVLSKLLFYIKFKYLLFILINLYYNHIFNLNIFIKIY